MLNVKRLECKIILKSLRTRQPKERQTKLAKKSLKIPKGNQNSYIEEEQTTQWPKEKEQKDKQMSTKLTYKTKDRVT